MFQKSNIVEHEIVTIFFTVIVSEWDFINYYSLFYISTDFQIYNAPENRKQSPF
jgi:hypothetical protein